MLVSSLVWAPGCSESSQTTLPRTPSSEAEAAAAPGQDEAEPAPRAADTPGAGSPTGRFRPRKTAEPEEDDPLNSIGYSAGSQPASEYSGVTRHLTGLSSPGLNFVVSGHMPGAELLDMEGNVLHTWSAKFEDIWPQFVKARERPDSRFWRRAHLFENGDVLAIFESLGIVKLDHDSNILWARQIPVHHDLQVMEDGSFYALGRKITLEEDAVPTVRKLSSLRPPDKRDDQVSILQDYVLHYLPVADSPGYELEESISLYRSFTNAGPKKSWNRPAIEFWKRESQRSFTANHRDIFHTNSLFILDGGIADRAPAFAKGNVLVSLRHLDMIAVVEPEENKTIWTLRGASTLQHDAQISSEGHLLYFDNQWKPGRTRIVLMDPATREIIWEYGTQTGEEFYSETCGTVQELPNGNLLVSETDSGRAFEVTRDRKIAWEFYNPHGVGEDDEFIASLFEVLRLDAQLVGEWLQ